MGIFFNNSTDFSVVQRPVAITEADHKTRNPPLTIQPGERFILSSGLYLELLSTALISLLILILHHNGLVEGDILHLY